MNSDLLAAVVESILLTAHGPVTVAAIAEALAEEEINATEVEVALQSISEAMASDHRGVRLERVAGGWRCIVPPHLDPYLQAFHGVATRQRLSQAALEVLSIVAHRQPVTLPELNFIRGTNSVAVVRTLLDRKLIRMAGRKKVVGKPFLYRTTKEFLVHFGLDGLDELPEPEDLAGARAGDEP